MDSLSLKWGTLKAWHFPDNEPAQALLREYMEIGSSVSAMTQKDTPRQKEIICELIDVGNCKEGVYLDWDGKHIPKDEAKDYIRNYW